MTDWQIVNANVLEWAASYDGEPFHAALCDPPYHLHNGMTKPRPDLVGYDKGKGNPYARIQTRLPTGGFMGKEWDGGGVAFDPATWAALTAHLLPGAFVMAFGGSRTYHRLACALEDAGLRIHPCLGWLQSQGFPKSTRIDVAVDRAAGAEREPCNFHPNTKGRLSAIHQESQSLGSGWGGKQSLPATPLARAWASHRYGLQALKPCLELVALAQKAYSGKPVDSITATGAGALNIDGGRIETGGEAWKRPMPDSPAPKFNGRTFAHDEWTLTQMAQGANVEGHSQGRWPPNMALCHSPGCTRLGGVRRVKGSHSMGNCQGKEYPDGDCGSSLFPEFSKSAGYHHVDKNGLESVTRYACAIACPACSHQWTAEERAACPECGEVGEWACAVRRLGEQGGQLKSNSGNLTWSNRKHNVAYGKYEPCPTSGITDEGSCARFYPNPDYHHETAERLATVDSVRYCAKAARRERDAGLDSLQPVEYNEAKSTGGKQWENTGQSPSIQAEGDIQQQKATIDLQSGILKPNQREMSSPTSGSGSKLTGQSHKGIASIIGTETSKITDLKTSHSLTSRLTSGCTVGVNSETEPGGSPAMSVGNSRRLQKSSGTLTKGGIQDTESASNATSKEWSVTSANARQDKGPKEAANRVRTRNPHPT